MTPQNGNLAHTLDNVAELHSGDVEIAREIPLDDVLITGRTWPLLPEGAYLVEYTHHETALVFRTPKVFVPSVY